MQVYFGLGANQGERRHNLSRGLAELERAGMRTRRISPVVESPALLPEGAPAAWNRPYLNLVVEAEVDGSPHAWRDAAKAVERTLGRVAGSRWSPRPLDVDILLWGREVIRDPILTIPHRDLHRRPFELAPLVHLDPGLTIPGRGEKTILEWSAELPHRIPLWMGIVNATPDSFSGRDPGFRPHDLEPAVEEMLAFDVHILDVGAESTGPGARPLTPPEEWSRLEPVLEMIWDKIGGARLRPLVSVDTRHPEVAERALALDVDIINDVSGLTTPAMMAVARSRPAQWVAMHSVTVPADPGRTLPAECDPIAEVTAWLAAQRERWRGAGLDLGRIIFDPGIGFGKDPLQALRLLRHLGRLQPWGHRLLVGHSRKLRLGAPGATPPAERDIETVGASLKLCEKGVDILRVHDVASHVRAYRAWSHLEA